jgi:hypothetical protein
MIMDGVAVHRCGKGIGFEYDLRTSARISATSRDNFQSTKAE